MALKIRLRQQGRRNRLSYRLVVTDSRERRDGKYIESLGWYDPLAKDADAQVDSERIAHWLSNGAQPTEKVISLIERCAPDAMKNFRKEKNAKKGKDKK